jgi:hypothetical protein
MYSNGERVTQLRAENMRKAGQDLYVMQAMSLLFEEDCSSKKPCPHVKPRLPYIG